MRRMSVHAMIIEVHRERFKQVDQSIGQIYAATIISNVACLSHK